MSAYVVSKDHLDLLVTAAMHGSRYYKGLRVGGRVFDSPEDANELGAILWAENVRSVNYRYHLDDWEEVYTYDPAGIAPYLGGLIDWGHVLGALSCYEYQACETDNWETTQAYQVCQALRRKVCGIIADRAGGGWSWSRQYVTDELARIRAQVNGGAK